MVTAILADFDRIAIKEFIAKPIEGLIASIVGSILPVSGARAAGGPVSAGAAYLVGEQGPELFVPSGQRRHRSRTRMRGAARPQIVMNVQRARCAELPQIGIPDRRHDVACPGARAEEYVNRNCHPRRTSRAKRAV